MSQITAKYWPSSVRSSRTGRSSRTSNNYRLPSGSRISANIAIRSYVSVIMVIIGGSTPTRD
jgi:hypothetical protein